MTRAGEQISSAGAPANGVLIAEDVWGIPKDQQQALRWVTAAVPQLGESWGFPFGIDAWEAMRSAVFVKALECVRGSAGTPLPFAARLRRGLQALVGPKRLLGARLPGRHVESGRGEVVCWPTEITHVRCQLPLASALQSLGSAPLFVATKPAVLRALRAGGVEPLYAPEVWGPALRAARAEAVRRARVLRKAPRPALPALPFGEGSAPAEMTDTFLDLLPEVAEAVTVAETIFEECGARVLVVGNDLTLEGRSASLSACRRGVRVACLMHGAVAGSPLQAHHLADRFLVYGNASRDTLLQLGLPNGRIAVVGAPGVLENKGEPHVFQNKGEPHRAIRALLRLDPGEPWALVATSGPGHSVSAASHERFVRALADIAARHPEWKLVAKLHRKDRVRYYEEATREARGLTWIPAGTPGLPDDIGEWLAGCTVLVTGASTSAIDAMLVDVPVITVDLDGELSDVDFIRAGATTHVRDANSLERELPRALQAGSPRPGCSQAVAAYLEATFAARGPRAAEAAAREIHALRGPA